MVHEHPRGERESFSFISEIDVREMAGQGVVDDSIMFSSKSHRIDQQIRGLRDRNSHRHPDNEIRWIVMNNSADANTMQGVTHSRRAGDIEAFTIPTKTPEVALDLVHRLDHERGRIDVVFWDEFQFLPYEVVPVIMRFMDEGRVQWVAGIRDDFRGEPFLVMDHIKRILEGRIRHAPDCAFVDDTMAGGRRQCTNPAVYNMRVVKDPRDPKNHLYFSPVHLPFNAYVRDKDDIDKIERIFCDGYIAAPYWHKTIHPREENPPGERNVDYVPVCTDHFFVPRKEETLKALERIRRGSKQGQAVPGSVLEMTLGEPMDLKNIMAFLQEERGVALIPETGYISLADYR